MGLGSMLTRILYNPNTMALIPMVGLAVAVLVGIRWRSSLAVKIAAVVSGTAGIAYAFWANHAITTMRSSTSAIWYLFMPQTMVLICGIVFLVIWSLVVLVLRLRVKPVGGEQTREAAWAVYAAAVLLIVFGVWGAKAVARNMQLSRAENVASESRLGAIYDRAVARKDAEVLSKLAANPNASSQFLEKIYSLISAERPMRSFVDYDPVYRELAKNKNTPGSILGLMSRQERYNYKYYIAQNPGTPSDVLETLAADDEQIVRKWVCSNPNVTEATLTKLSNDSDKIVSNAAKVNLQKKSRQPSR